MHISVPEMLAERGGARPDPTKHGGERVGFSTRYHGRDLFLLTTFTGTDIAPERKI